ncbi:uncharacterized protein L969DRAFT_44971 [Mixia osmundae IAM 14324]|uniref:Uncharacterized protein n=1 Tax=Mixia osmundae (strain CBS 9802 / IAM 14324 / JCM 22182 / KY 12970) TaxID=764103 RepID=G7DXV5_MIXOS|nr:uncharacterized protein L969DRAFT_44971 [Mixia osmundae IAM 14324]KEI41318.1 hypothetical protein L969DRAFT_44971 [Mixia osmundae IAM 14324]GAA95415.1 hypothetical protein E5Q_02069 [Mixia osmundae IAM 14324]
MIMLASRQTLQLGARTAARARFSTSRRWQSKQGDSYPANHTAPNKDGHVVEKAKSGMSPKDIQTESATKGLNEGTKTVEGASELYKKNTGNQSMKDFQPGQMGEQTGGTMHRGANGASAGSMGGTSKAYSTQARRRFTTSVALLADAAKEKPTTPHPPATSHVTASTASPEADKTYVKGQPEPDSYQREYETVTEGQPSSEIDPSALSRRGELGKKPSLDTNPSGVGSSNEIHESAKQAVDMMSKKGTTKAKKSAAVKDRQIPPDFRTEDASELKFRPPRKSDKA